MNNEFHGGNKMKMILKIDIDTALHLLVEARMSVDGLTWENNCR